jgi:hypothetical protein
MISNFNDFKFQESEMLEIWNYWKALLEFQVAEIDFYLRGGVAAKSR